MEFAKILISTLLQNLPDGINPKDLDFKFHESLDNSNSYLMIGFKNREEL